MKKFILLEQDINVLYQAGYSHEETQLIAKQCETGGQMAEKAKARLHQARRDVGMKFIQAEV